jgi:hypothetical protein
MIKHNSPLWSKNGFSCPTIYDKFFVVAIQMVTKNQFQLPSKKCGSFDGNQFFSIANDWIGKKGM